MSAPNPERPSWQPEGAAGKVKVNFRKVAGGFPEVVGISGRAEGNILRAEEGSGQAEGNFPKAVGAAGLGEDNSGLAEGGSEPAEDV